MSKSLNKVLNKTLSLIIQSDTPKKGSPNKQKDAEVKPKFGFEKTLFYMPMRGYKACWPYVTFSGFRGYVWLFNAYKPDRLYRIQPPYGSKRDQDDKLRVLKTFITNDEMLYILMVSRSKQ
jgi:hypothetical protein